MEKKLAKNQKKNSISSNSSSGSFTKVEVYYIQFG